MGERRSGREARRPALEMEAAVESMAEAVVVYDREGRFTHSSHAARAQFGIDPTGAKREEVFSRLDVRGLDGRLVPLDALPSARAPRGERVLGMPFSIRVANGRRLTVDVSTMPVIEAGEQIGAVSVWRDVTEQFDARSRLADELSTTRALLTAATTLAEKLLMADVVRAVADTVAGIVPRTRVECCGGTVDSRRRSSPPRSSRPSRRTPPACCATTRRFSSASPSRCRPRSPAPSSRRSRSRRAELPASHHASRRAAAGIFSCRGVGGR